MWVVAAGVEMNAGGVVVAAGLAVSTGVGLVERGGSGRDEASIPA